MGSYCNRCEEKLHIDSETGNCKECDEIIDLTHQLKVSHRSLVLASRVVIDYNKLNAACGYMSLDNTIKNFTQQAEKDLVNGKTRL